MKSPNLSTIAVAKITSQGMGMEFKVPSAVLPLRKYVPCRIRRMRWVYNLSLAKGGYFPVSVAVTLDAEGINCDNTCTSSPLTPSAPISQRLSVTQSTMLRTRPQARQFGNVSHLVTSPNPHRIPPNPFIGPLPFLNPLSPYQPINPTLVTQSPSMDATRTKMPATQYQLSAYDLLILIPRVRCFGLVRFTFAQT